MQSVFAIVVLSLASPSETLPSVAAVIAPVPKDAGWSASMALLPTVTAEVNTWTGEVDSRSNDSGQSPRYSLADFEAMAISGHPLLRQSMARIQAARGRWQQVGLKPNPTVGYLANEMGNEGSAGQQGGFLSQRFVRGNKLQLNRQVECQEIAKRTQQLAVEKRRVLTAVRTNYYLTLISRRSVEVAEQVVAVNRNVAQKTDALLVAGEVRKADALQATVALERSKNELLSAQNELQASWRQLGSLVGMHNSEIPNLDGDAETLPPLREWEPTLANLWANSPELSAAYADVEKAKWAYQRALAEPIPDLQTQLSVQHDGLSQDIFTGLQIGIRLPVHDRNQGAICEARSMIAAAEHNVEFIRQQLQQQLAIVFGKYQTAYQTTRRYRERILPQARQSLDLATEGFPVETNYVDVLIAQRSYFQANIDYLDSLRDTHAQSIRIESFLRDNEF